MKIYAILLEFRDLSPVAKLGYGGPVSVETKENARLRNIIGKLRQGFQKNIKKIRRDGDKFDFNEYSGNFS